MRRCRPGTGELRDAPVDTQARAAGQHPVVQGGVAGQSRRRRVALRILNDLAWELLMPRQPLRVGMRGGVDDNVDPRVEFIVAASSDLDTCGRRALEPGLDSAAEYVLKRFQPVAASGQELANLGIGKVGQLDLRWRAAGRECLLDLVECSSARHAAE